MEDSRIGTTVTKWHLTKVYHCQDVVCITITRWPQFGLGKLRSFQGLSTTFSRPIPVLMYHNRQCLCYHLILLTTADT